MLSGNILTPDGWINGSLSFENGRITAITGVAADPAKNDAPYILPGFIDLHVHGGGGADVMEAGDAIETIARTHARYGTTSLLATTMTAPRDELMNVVAGLGDVTRNRTPGARACWACTSKGRTSTPASSARNPTRRFRPCSTKCSSTCRSRPFAW